jgi:hypothetical protein
MGMAKQLFGFRTLIPTEAEIDRGAKALRKRQMAGRVTRHWKSVPKSERQKWRKYAKAVLCAAYKSK